VSLNIFKSRLPEGWKIAPLDEVSDINMGQSPPSSTYNVKGEGLPFFQGKAEFGSYYPETKKWCSAPAKLAQNGDILISVRAPVGPTNLAPMECCIGRGLAAITPLGGMPSRYLLYFLRSIEADIDSLGTGSTFKAISGKILRSIKVPVAPPDQQTHIVAEIEKQFSRLDEAVANLKRVKANLKRYKAAVLKAAVEGKLTEEWRRGTACRAHAVSDTVQEEIKGNQGTARRAPTETGAELLERILAERREKWQGRGKYKEPVAPNTTDLPELPEEWVWASVDQLVAHVTDGDHQAPPQTEHGIPFLVIGNVRSGKIDLTNTRFVGEPYYDSLDPKRQPQKGDLLYTLVGSYGIPVPVTIDSSFCIQRHMAILRPHAKTPMDYLSLVMNSDSVYKQATAVATGTAQMTVPLAGLRTILIPLPPLEEQHQIVAEVERRLSIVTEAEAQVVANLRRADRLRQSILKQAFSGQLVPQYLNEEPAAANKTGRFMNRLYENHGNEPNQSAIC